MSSPQPIETDIIIIGAGPVGLFTVFEAGLLKLRCHLIDALAQPGGQLTEIYPKKPIYDIPGFPDILAGDLIDNLMKQAEPFKPGFTLGERAELVGQIGSLLQQVQQTTGEQRAAIEHLVGSATGVLDRVGQQFADTVGAQAGRAEAMAEQAATSAAQLASLGEAFGVNTVTLTSAQIPAHAEPLVGDTGPYRDVRAPDRPTTRIYVEKSRLAEARLAISDGLPSLRAEFHADAAARADQDR